jgi:hypothetical protein
MKIAKHKTLVRIKSTGAYLKQYAHNAMYANSAEEACNLLRHFCPL